MRQIQIHEKILIAGASGMVGSAINRALLKKGYGNKSNGGDIFTPSRKELDFSNYEKLLNWFNKFQPSVVIIAAAKVGGILANKNNPYDFIFENLKIQINIIEICRICKIKKIIFLGSSCIYPKLSDQPIKEEYLLKSPLEKTNEFYAIAKIAGLKMCEALNLQYDFDAFSLMPTNLYGPRDNYNLENSHVLPALIRKFDEAKRNNLNQVKCWGSGKPLREFLYVDDLADACIFVLENINQREKKFENNWLNVGSEFEISIKNLAIKISKIIGFNGEIIWDLSKPDGTPRKKLDTSILENMGWKAKTNLNEGIAITYENYLDELKKNSLRV